MASGQLRDSVVTVDGDEIVHSLYGPGMVVGEPGFFAPERNRVVAVVALEPCTLLELGREHLVPRLLRHPPAMIRLLEGLATVARGQTEIIAALARRPLSERLLLQLLDLADTNEDDGTGVTPRVSQTTMAAMVGTSRENVNRALAALADRGGRHAVLRLSPRRRRTTGRPAARHAGRARSTGRAATASGRPSGGPPRAACPAAGAPRALRNEALRRGDAWP